MKKYLAGTLLLLALVVAPAAAIDTPHIAGSMQGWDPAANPMDDMGGGIYQLAFGDLGAGARHEWKVTNGTWDETIPGPNSWLYADGDGNITITYDSNTYDDGWAPSVDRLGLDVDPGAWTAVGGWQGWDNANPATAMDPLGGGIYMYEQVFDPGDYEWKAVVTGTWDSISWDGRSVNTANMAFSTDDVNDTARMFVNAFEGTVKLEIVPEPATLAALALLGLLVRRR